MLGQAFSQLSAEISQIVRQMLGRAVSEEQPLTEAGLDSLGALELRASLASAFNLELPATLIFDYPSISALAKFLASQAAAPKQVTSFILCFG